MTGRSLLRVGMAGGLGGGANATLCYLRKITSVLWTPVAYFGAVAGLLYASLLLAKRSVDRRGMRLAGAIAAGTLGSLWWWIEWGPWYFSILHGSLWGGLVGLALSRGDR